MPAHTVDSDRILRAHPVNLRDLGGTPTRHGTTVHPGRLLRSDDLSVVQPREVTGILDDIGLVVDLRSAEEEQLFGLALLPERTERLRTYVEFGIMPTGAEFADELTALPRTPEELGRVYAEGIRSSATQLRDTLERIADEPRGTLVHCVAGKDRTGVLVALLLTAIEVPRPLIVEDYAATAANMPALLATVDGLLSRPIRGGDHTNDDAPEERDYPDLSSLEDLLPGVLLDAPAAAMQTCLDDLDASHGSPLGPLRDAGLDASVEATLRSRLVQDHR
ncbi:MAG: tyrosine-protein phosphatase [Nitriliruptoraceae bacterium]